MKKAADLRKHISTWVPDLGKNEDKLHVFIEKGTVATKLVQGLGFQYAYTLQIVITDFGESPDVVIVPILAWLQKNQPDLLQDPVRRDRAIAIEAEIIDNDKVDIQFTVELTEGVTVRDVPSGFECQHIGEPNLDELLGLGHGVKNWQIYLKGEPLAAGNG